MEIYVVRGCTGEYSDRFEWLVRAFTEEGKAQEFVSKLDEWCRLHNVNRRDDRGKMVDYSHRSKLASPLDPNFCCNYTGTWYEYETVELEE